MPPTTTPQTVMLADFGQDLRYAARTLAKQPGFTTAAVLTLALGMGATTAIFSVVDRVLLQPLPYPQAERVVSVAWDGGGYLQALSAAKFQYWHDAARSFDSMATWVLRPARVETGAAVSAASRLEVSPDFLGVLGYAPALGRGFVPAEHAGGGPDVAVISHALWQADLGAAADLSGRTIRLNGQTVAVVGVLPQSFAFPYEDEPVDVIVPRRLTVDPDDIAENWPAIARLRQGVTHEQAQAEIASLTGPFRAAYPKQVSAQDRGMTLATFSELYVNANVRRALWLLMGAVTVVLLIACANVANLFLARASRRRGEIALRAALGATRGRITRLVLTEAVLVALASGALGLVTGRWIAGVLVALTPTEVPRMTAGIDGRAILFTFAVSLATSVLFGGAAAWPAARARVAEALKAGSRGNSGRNRIRQGLLVAQSGLSMVLLAGAGLLVVTLIGLTRLDPGFDAEGLVAVRIPAKPPGYETAQAAWEFERRVIERLDRAPGIISIAGASSLPLERGINTPMSLDGRPDVVGTVEWRAVTPGYFQTLGIPLVAGRTLTDTDVPGGAPVAIVNESFARRHLPGESAIGKRLAIGRSATRRFDPSVDGPSVEIVGVVADIREVSLRAEPRRTIYVPQAQASSRLSNLGGTMPLFIARGRLADVARVVTSAIHTVDPALPRPQVFSFDDIVARSLARERFGAMLLSVLAAFALALTAFGLYAVLASTVQQRRREIGIRIALGASGGQVARLVMIQGLAPVLVGGVLGVLSAVGLSRLVAGFLWGVAPTDPATFAATAAMLLGVALAASWIPARAASGVDPENTLNCE